MPIVAAAFVACIILLRLWPGLPMSRALSAMLVAPLARRVAALTPGHWLLFAMVTAAAGMVLWMGGDMIIVSALGTPELAAALAMIDVAAYLDAALAAFAVAGAVRGTAVRLWVGRLLPRPRGRRTRPVRMPRKATNDDGPVDWLAVA